MEAIYSVETSSQSQCTVRRSIPEAMTSQSYQFTITTPLSCNVLVSDVLFYIPNQWSHVLFKYDTADWDKIPTNQLRDFSPRANYTD
jgi:hypothetical protein